MSAVDMVSTTQAIINFNKKIKLLSKEITQRFPNDAIAFRTQKQIILAIDTYPTCIIDAVGEYLYSYRNKILDKPTEDVILFFNQLDYKEQLKNSEIDEKEKSISYFIPKIKDVINNMKPQEKKQYILLITDLIYDFIDYKISQQ